MDNKRFILTGGPGTGKTTTLCLLESLGYRCIPEVAREIIARRVASGLSPRPDSQSFALQILEEDIRRYDDVGSDEITFFDRGIVDAVGMLYESTAIDIDRAREEIKLRPFNSTAFYFPAWPEIYRTDDQRNQTLEQSVEIASRILSWYRTMGYGLIEVPRASPEERATFIRGAIQAMP